MNRVIAGLLFLLVVWAVPASATTVVTLPQGGTVTFCETTTQGTYITGDPWIIGPVTICDRSTKDVDGVAPDIHGCMVNPIPPTFTSTAAANIGGITQGWDQRDAKNAYSATLNRCDSFPSTSIANGSSILFAVSLTNALPNGPCTTKSLTSQVSYTYQCTKSIDVVTVVASDPNAGGNVFRPAWTGTDKSYTPLVSSIRYDVLKDHPLVTNQPTLATLEAEGIMRGPYIQIDDGSETWERYAPVSRWNMIRSPGSTTSGAQAYGRAVNWGISDVLGALHANYTNAEKTTMAIRFVQTAIDLYGQIGAGRNYFQGKAGFCLGANTILLTGASLLNNQAMMNAGGIGVNPSRFCQEFFWKYVDATAVATGRSTYCGSNLTTKANFSTCLAFDNSMLGRPAACWNLNTWENPANPNCSADPHTTYHYLNNPFIMQFLSLKWMSLKTEYGWPAAFDYILNEGTAVAWGDGTWANYAQTHNVGPDAPCSNSSNFQSSAIRQYICTLYNTYQNETPTEGSISGEVVPNVGPTSALVGPSSNTTQTTSSATITLTGTAADSDGTVSTTTCASTKDAAITNTGTATAWSCTVDLPSDSVSVVTITSTDDDGAVATPITVTVLRASSTCTGLSDAFSLDGTWTAPNPFCWVNMAGSLSWTQNHLVAPANARNLFYFNSAINNDQQASVTIDTTPTTNVWVYGIVRASVSGSTYNGMACTAENPTSYIARWVSGVRQQLGSGFSMVSGPWAAGDVLGCRAIGQQYCTYRNGVQVGCETDGSAVYTSGFAGAGAYGTNTGFSNFVATSQAGGGDITNPLVAIVTPPGVLQVAATPYTLAAGTASDAVGVTTCTWLIAEHPSVNGSCGGTALPNTSVSWTIASIGLSSGINTLRVTVMDAAGNNATASEVISYVPASTVVATFTYPTSDATWTQRGRLVDLMGTMTAAQCTSVLLTNVSDPNPVVGGTIVVATGADSWSARVALVAGLNDVQIDCMNGAAGTGTSLLTVHKYVTSLPLAKRR